uniref:Uncharacterized protein n=1 Tax=Nelumbo nucifera TaxID=4432 RepID=A0A822Y9J5_NELNU|nr:TPA_asm: hypothetical protein HUJ06_030430 [Nelumbo nucifera]
MHFVLSFSPASSSTSAFISTSTDLSISGSFEFEFSARFPSNASTTTGSMVSTYEMFLNGQIRPMKLVEKHEESLMRGRDMRLRSGSLHRRSRYLSPLRNTPFQRYKEEEYQEVQHAGELHPLYMENSENKQAKTPSMGTTASVSTSSSRSSSSGRRSKRWFFLKNFFYRSKREGRGNKKKSSSTSLPFSSSKEKKSSVAPTKAEAQKLKRSQ